MFTKCVIHWLHMSGPLWSLKHSRQIRNYTNKDTAKEGWTLWSKDELKLVPNCPASLHTSCVDWFILLPFSVRLKDVSTWPALWSDFVCLFPVCFWRETSSYLTISCFQTSLKHAWSFCTVLEFVIRVDWQSLGCSKQYMSCSWIGKGVLVLEYSKSWVLLIIPGLVHGLSFLWQPCGNHQACKSPVFVCYNIAYMQYCLPWDEAKSGGVRPNKIVRSISDDGIRLCRPSVKASLSLSSLLIQLDLHSQKIMQGIWIIHP